MLYIYDIYISYHIIPLVSMIRTLMIPRADTLWADTLWADTLWAETLDTDCFSMLALFFVLRCSRFCSGYYRISLATPVFLGRSCVSLAVLVVFHGCSRFFLGCSRFFSWLLLFFLAVIAVSWRFLFALG